jgi:hypothetical protein
MTRLIGLNDDDPLDSATVNQHCNADHGLRDNMLRHGLIYYLMGQWWLTAKGRRVMQERGRARQDAMRMGLVQAAPKDAPRERDPFEDLL